MEKIKKNFNPPKEGFMCGKKGSENMEEIKIAQVILTNQKIQRPTGYACISVQLYFVKIKYQIVFSFISLSDGNIFHVLYVPSKCKERMRLQEQFSLMFLNAPI